MFFSLGFAQDYKKAPKANERVLGTVTEGWRGSSSSDHSSYVMLLEKAKEEYPDKLIDLRSFMASYDYSSDGSIYNCSAKVVEFISQEVVLNETLVKAVDKALSKVSAGSRLAIDQVSVSGELSRETVNDQLLSILNERNYRVIAKEYFERLKEELKEQKKGGYNVEKTADADNFSGVGYFLNVRVDEKSIRIQVINISTGEYEGNAAVEF